MREDHKRFDKSDDRNQESSINNCVSKVVNSTSVEVSEPNSSFRRIEGIIKPESISTRLKPIYLEKRSNQSSREAVNLRKKQTRETSFENSRVPLMGECISTGWPEEPGTCISKMKRPGKHCKPTGDSGYKAANSKQRKCHNLNFLNSSGSLPDKAEGSFVQLLDELGANNSNYELSRKRPFEEMSDPGSEAIILKKRKTCDLSFENLNTSGQTSLHHDAAEDKIKMHDLLVSNGDFSWDSCYITTLHHFAAQGNLNMCQLLVSKGAHIDALDDKRRTLLYRALQEGHMSVATYLIEKGANLNLKVGNLDYGGLTALHHFSAKGKLDVCKLLVSKGALVDALDDNSHTPLHYALSKEQTSVAHYLLKKGANPNLNYNRGLTALHHFAAQGKLDICQLLVSKGAHIDALDNKSRTPLHYALQKEQISVAYYLLKKGANPNLNYHRGLTTLHHFAAQGKLDVCQLLVSNGAKIKGAMHHAATKGLLNMCQLLFSKGAHIDDLDDNRRTPLHCALQEGQISVAHYFLEMGANTQGAMHHASAKGLLDMCQLLFSKGAHIDALDDKWHTPLHYALQEGQISVVHYLLEKGANPNLNYHRELTALHYFAAQGKLDVCQLLVSNGALIDVVDNRRCTPLHLALQEGQVSVANYLVEMGANVKGAMHHAAAKGLLDICKLLFSKGAHIDYLDDKRRTPLHCALQEGQISVAHYLLDMGANIKGAMHHAAAKGLLDICKLLFSKGAHIDALDDKWHTPLHYALQEGQISVVRYLEKRANPDNSSDVSIQDRVNVADPGCLTAGADSDEDTPLVIDEQPGGTALRPYDVPLFKSPFLCPALCECWNVTAEVGKFTPQSSCSRPEEQKEPAPSSYESFSDVQSPPKLKRWVSKDYQELKGLRVTEPPFKRTFVHPNPT